MRTRRGGFSLVELILTVAIGSVLVLGIVLFTRTQVVNSVRSSDFLAALNLGRMKMADLDRQAFASLPVAGTTTEYTDSTLPGLKMRLVVTEIERGGAGINLRFLNRLDLSVDHAGGNFASPLVTLTTYRQNGTSFGNGT